MTRIIQISDTHIVPAGQLAYDRVDTASALTETVATINRMLPRIGPLDLVLVTGDLTDFGTPEEYARFRSIIEELAVPCRAVPGNHDNRQVMREAFKDCAWMPETGPIDWSLDLDDFLLVGLDCSVVNSAHGWLEESSLKHLANCLANSGKAVLTGMHHPPFHSGLRVMDKQNLRNAGALMDVLGNQNREIRLVCGHLHRSIIRQIGGVVCQVAPGPSHAVNLDLRPDAGNDFVMEPGAFVLHEWRDGFVSHVIPVGEFSGPWPFYGSRD